jgi:hypothetical protein
MKNIHALPTDKPSRLIKSQDNDFVYLNTNAPNWFENNLKTTKQNIYITSDEELKEGDWWLNIKTNDVDKCTHKSEVSVYNSQKYQHIKKIILTTDVDLIKDGVQAIDDEFLEWFVKNPSCEKVKVEDFPMTEKYNSKGEYVHRSYWVYKIIIPKEEPKQETLEGLISEYHSIAYEKLIKELTEQETFKNYPVIIVRNDDKEEFIHLSNGMYRTKWGILHDSISSTPLESFDKSKFTFYYE